MLFWRCIYSTTLKKYYVILPGMFIELAFAASGMEV